MLGINAQTGQPLAGIDHLRQSIRDILTTRMGDALLSDHSGVLWQDGVTKLSFGRVRVFTPAPLALAIDAGRDAARFAWARLLDRWLLDFSRLGDAGHTPNPARSWRGV